MELLQHQPGTKTGAIAQATGSPVVTVQDRLRRLRQRGDGDGRGRERLGSDGASIETEAIAPAPPSFAPWVRSINEYGCRAETTNASVARFG